MLTTLATDFDLAWTTIEIAEDPNLLTLYELKIPVIKRVELRGVLLGSALARGEQSEGDSE